MEEKRNLKGLIAVCLLVLSLVLITVGTTFAFFQYSRQGTAENKIETGTLTFIYDEKRSDANKISLTNAFPMSEGEGKTQTGNGVFEFQVRAKTKGADISYEIYLTKEEESTLPEAVVRVYLTSEETALQDTLNKKELNYYNELGDSKVPELNKGKGKTLYQETIENSDRDYTKDFKFRMWIDEKANQVVNGSWIYNDMTFSVKVNVYAQNGAIDDPTAPSTNPYQEPQDKSGANVPALVEGLIPVVYDGAQQKWVKAGYAGWYNYDKQEWANAVTVTATHRNTYQEAEPGIEIPMEDINTMLVWIPRYEYNYTNMETIGQDINKPEAIDINFINGVNDTPSDSANYKVHPAFNFGDDKLTGIWYGKFETSNEEAIYGDNDDSRANNSSLTPIIKPGVPSWRFISLSNMFYASRKMQTEKYEVYGFKNDLVSYDIHMSKNSEWGAVAYLSQSKYGKYGNAIYGENDKEVYINNCSNHITGIAGDTVNAAPSDICTNTYDTIQGQKASTTGNITGIYDMSGGSYDRVMGALDNSGKPTIASSEFVEGEDGNKIPDSKYYDLYGSSIDTACSDGVCYGHALSETSAWYGDFHTYISSTLSWFARGGGDYDRANAGVFYFNGSYGAPKSTGSFRIVLVPTGV